MGLRALWFAFLLLTPTYALSLPTGRPVIKAAASAASKAVATAGQAVQRAPRLAAASFALGVGVGVAASSVQDAAMLHAEEMAEARHQATRAERVADEVRFEAAKGLYGTPQPPHEGITPPHGPGTPARVLHLLKPEKKKKARPRFGPRITHGGLGRADGFGTFRN